MGRDCKEDDNEIRDFFYDLIFKELKEIKHKMATKQDLDAKEQVVLTAIQALSDLVNAGAAAGFDTAPEIATLQQMLDLANAMIAKLQGTVTPGAPVISSLLVAAGSVNVPFTYQTVASNSPTNYSAVGLLAGLSMDAGSGLISGTPTVAGVSSIAVTATNANGSDTESLVLTVNP